MLATISGLAFSHSPECGLLKSGMPDGVLIPAPVRATANCALRSRSTACWISESIGYGSHLHVAKYNPDTFQIWMVKPSIAAMIFVQIAHYSSRHAPS